MKNIWWALVDRYREFQETFSTWSSKKKLLFVGFLLLWLGSVVYLWFLTPAAPATQQSKDKEEVVHPVTAQPSPDDVQEEKKTPSNPDNDFSSQERKAAQAVAKKYLRIYYEEPRRSPQELAEKLSPYASSEILQSIEESMKVPEPVPIKKIVLSEIEPPFISDGVTYHAILTTEKEEMDLWFSMQSVDGEWRVVQEEAM